MTAQAKTAGRPGISEQQYIRQIERWINEGLRIDEITGTKLQKIVGGTYRKACEILDRFKEGYASKELAALPPVPDELINALNSAVLDAWRVLYQQKDLDVKEATKQFEQDKAKLQVENSEQAERIDELLEEIKSLKYTSDEIDLLMKESESDNRKLREALSQVRSDTAIHKQKVELMEKQAEKTEARLEKAEAGKKEAEALQSEASTKLAVSQQKNNSLCAQLGALKSQLESEHERNRELVKSLAVRMTYNEVRTASQPENKTKELALPHTDDAPKKSPPKKAATKKGAQKKFTETTQTTSLEKLIEQQVEATTDGEPDFSQYPEIVTSHMADEIVDRLKSGEGYRDDAFKLGEVARVQYGIDLYRVYGCKKCKRTIVSAGRTSKAKMIEIHKAVHGCDGK